jgi:hypothetical protein
MWLGNKLHQTTLVVIEVSLVYLVQRITSVVHTLRSMIYTQL